MPHPLLQALSLLAQKVGGLGKHPFLGDILSLIRGSQVSTLGEGVYVGGAVLTGTQTRAAGAFTAPTSDPRDSAAPREGESGPYFAIFW